MQPDCVAPASVIGSLGKKREKLVHARANGALVELEIWMDVPALGRPDSKEFARRAQPVSVLGRVLLVRITE